MHVLNTEYFGQVMLPLDWHHNLQLEDQQFSYMRNEALGKGRIQKLILVFLKYDIHRS